LLSAALVLTADAQLIGNNEIGFLLGGSVTPELSIADPAGNSIDFGAGHTFQATYARHLLTLPVARLSLEVPFFAAPSIKLDSASQVVPLEYASLFVTPGFRLTLMPDQAISPWVSVGGGYALFEHASELLSGEPNDAGNRHTGAIQFGGGLDIRTPVRVLFPISLRLEIRDLYS
jgi:hypothetical protein